MKKNQSLSNLEGNFLTSDLEEDQDAADNSSDAVSSPPHSPAAQRGSSYNSFNQIPVWPQSYRQSMDIYSSVGSPSYLSPSYLSSSYISGSFRRQSIYKPSSLTTSFLSTKGDEGEIPEYQQIPSLPSKRTSLIALQDAHGVPAGCGVTQAILNGINVLCGVGILSTPYAVREGGWLSLGILFLLSFVSWYTGILLRRCLDFIGGSGTYPDIGLAAFGKFGRILISIILYLELYAACVEYLILEGDNLAALFPSASLSLNGYNLTATEVFTIATAIVVLPTVWLRDLKLLSYVSAGGVIATLVLVICLSWVGVVDNVGFHHSGPVLKLSSLPVSIGLFGFCFSGHSVFPNIYSSLKKPSDFTKVLTVSFIICTLMYGGVAVMGYMMFGEDTQSQITLSLPDQFIASKIAVWSTVVNPLTKYALSITPFALSLEELVPRSGHDEPSYLWSFGIRTILVLSTLCVAFLVPFFAYIMAFIGSFLSMLMCLIFPAACFLKLMGGKDTGTMIQRFSCVLIIIIGVACAVTGTYSSLSQIINSLRS